MTRKELVEQVSARLLDSVLALLDLILDTEDEKLASVYRTKAHDIMDIDRLIHKAEYPEDYIHQL